MYSCKNAAFALVSLIILVTAIAVLMPFVSRGQVKPLKHDPRRSFYLTQTGYNGSQALTACAEGYHMASFWEIRDTSNLSYDTQLGFTRDDSGLGPPSGFAGWIRTGHDANEVPTVGLGNCQVWTSAASTDFGTSVRPPSIWNSANVTVIAPWEAFVFPCDSNVRVWCVQD